ncbi:MAG: IS30 family transposase [Candidatus Omnitrophica bacterium]|nr:IS30 family transposase [Candidatus Omnitrophota bacterium]MBU1871668.1 IS30 family transposase [Candidatus Omnitrophota bacterium]
MKNTYTQLSCEERDKIAVLRAKDLPLRDIAEIIGRNKSTISRELQRNSALVYDVYLPHKADRRAKERKCKAGIRPRLKDTMIRQYVTKKLKIGWSPEQIAGRLSEDHPSLSISHEAIYQYIYDKDTRKVVNLAIYLPRAHKKRKLFGRGHHHKAFHIPRRVSINERPKHIEKRKQSGHWEADTMVSRQSKKSLAISLERSSRLLHIDKLVAKESHKLVNALTRRLSCYPQQLRRTITYDNGSENVEHERINETLGTRSYFCNPFHSWEKGSVEYSIGLVRRFLPKKTDFAKISHYRVRKIEKLLNNRPRKCLNFQTPSEVFNSCVALTG